MFCYTSWNIFEKSTSLSEAHDQAIAQWIYNTRRDDFPEVRYPIIDICV